MLNQTVIIVAIFLSERQKLNDRGHAVEFQEMLEQWRQLHEASQTSIHVLNSTPAAPQEEAENRAND